MNEEFINKQLDTHERRLNSHSKKIDSLEKSDVATRVKIDNLCEKLDKQTKSINYLTTTLLGALVSFFFYAVQQGLFK